MADATNTAGGLVQMREMFEEHGREAAAKIAVLLTDGRSNIDSELTIPEAENAKNEGIDIYVVGTWIFHYSLSLSLSLPLSPFVYISLYHSLSLSLTILIPSLSVSIYIVSLSLSISLYFFLSLALFVFHLFISISLTQTYLAHTHLTRTEIIILCEQLRVYN